MILSFGNTYFDDVTGDVWTDGDDECEPFEPDIPDESEDFEDYDEYEPVDGDELVDVTETVNGLFKKGDEA